MVVISGKKIAEEEFVPTQNISKSYITGRSQTTFTRGGGYVVKKNPLFVNIFTIENVNGGR